MGVSVGVDEGRNEGAPDGNKDGKAEGVAVGVEEGGDVGMTEGNNDGGAVGGKFNDDGPVSKIADEIIFDRSHYDWIGCNVPGQYRSSAGEALIILNQPIWSPTETTGKAPHSLLNVITQEF